MGIQFTNGMSIIPNGNGGGGNTGGPGWYFYSDEGNLDADPPFANGNAIFLEGVGGIETFNPNLNSNNLILHFNLNNSVGDSLEPNFSASTQADSIVTITQGANVAEYFNQYGNGMNIVNIGSGSFFVINTVNCTQTKTAVNPFNFNDVITLSFSTGG
jgi:hypothetical protein